MHFSNRKKLQQLQHNTEKKLFLLDFICYLSSLAFTLKSENLRQTFQFCFYINNKIVENEKKLNRNS